jgi:hypothetical protein
LRVLTISLAFKKVLAFKKDLIVLKTYDLRINIR